MLLVADLALAMVNGGTPKDVPHSADCAIRRAAWEFGQKLLPERGGFRTLYDALQLNACNGESAAAPPAHDVWTPLSEPLPNNQLVLLVDPTEPSSLLSNSPRPGARFRTVHAAVEASRTLRTEPGQPVTIALRGGVHHLNSTLHLGQADSGLTLRACPGEEATLSAAVPLVTEWRPSSACRGELPAGCWEADLAGQGLGALTGLRLDGQRQIRARYPNFDPAQDRVIDGEYLVHDGHTGWIGEETEWIESGAHGMNGIPGVWPPEAAAQTFVIDDEDWPSVDWPMHITTNGTIDPSTWTGEGGWGQYWVGVGGTCVDRVPPVGYWCAPGAPRKISTPNHPVGMRPTSNELPHLPYANATGAIIHAWRPGHWYTNMFEVGGARMNGTAGAELNFSSGGFQGGEGVSGGEAWYIENVLEEKRHLPPSPTFCCHLPPSIRQVH